MAVIRLRGAILLALVFFIAVPGALFAAAQPAASVTPAAQAAAIEAEAAPANAGAVHIEQALVTLPAIRVYLHPDQAPGAGQIVGDIRAELGRQALTVEGLTAFDAEREGMLYIFLVDVSGSLRTAQTAAIKAALKSFSRELTPADRLALIAFGENTDILLYGGESQAAVDEAVDALHNRDQNTLFYNGIWQALDLAGQERGYPERRAAIVISDGVDDTPGGFYTKEETVKRLAAGGLPFYGLGLQRRDGRGNLLNKDELDAFGEIIRVSQGAAGQVFDAGGDSDNLSLKLAELRDYTRAARVLALRAKSNFAAGGTETLRLSLGAAPLLTLSVPVEPANSLPDRAAPYVTGVGRLPAPAIGVRVSFSEALMAGGATGGGELAGDILPYVAVTDAEGRNVPLLMATYQSGDGAVAGEIAASGDAAASGDGAAGGGGAAYCDLFFDGEPYTGEYSVVFSGLTDYANERHPLPPDKLGFSFAGRPVILKYLRLIFFDFWWALLILALIIGTLIVMSVLQNRRGLVKVDGQIGFGDMVEYKHRFETPPSKQVCLVVTDIKGNARNVELDINQSFFVGRADSNNLSFNDEKMSRQHFAIEAEGDSFYITDLQSTNGTFLNGARIQGRRRLADRDEIRAGHEKFIFRPNLSEAGGVWE